MPARERGSRLAAALGGAGLVAALLVDVPPAPAYEQADDLLAHQWITQQAWLFYRSQFGASEIDSFVGEVRTYPSGTNDRFIEGAYDEDVDEENPWKQSAPYLNHFWNVDSTTWVRAFDDGVGSADAAPNRAIKLFTGGRGLTGVYDTTYAKAQGAGRDSGLVWHYRHDTGNNARKGRAYYWLGEAAHLLQDLTLPCHALSDLHPPTDRDPTHDWVDGRAFATGFIGRAAFDDTTARRWEMWRFHPDTKAVGRAGSAAGLESGAIRSAAQLGSLSLRPEWTSSVPNDAQARSLPIYHLFLETAGLADNFDSRDYDGQRDDGARRDHGGAYANWTRDDLNGVADSVVARAMKATAELLRCFYSQVDSTPPQVVVPGLSGSEPDPTVLQSLSILVTAQATDATSGVDLDGYVLALEKLFTSNWVAQGESGPDLPEVWYVDLLPGTYRVRARVENGAGLQGTSPWAYFQLEQPVPVLVEELRAQAGADGVHLVWRTAPAGRRASSGIQVQRAAHAGGPWENLGPELVPEGDMSFHDAAAPVGGTLWYRLVLLTASGEAQLAGPVSVQVAGTPPATWLASPYVSGESIVLRYAIGGGSAMPVLLEIYDVMGRLVRRLERGVQPPGEYARAWDRRDEAGARVARGVYLVQLRTGADRWTRKLVLARD